MRCLWGGLTHPGFGFTPTEQHLRTTFENIICICALSFLFHGDYSRMFWNKIVSIKRWLMPSPSETFFCLLSVWTRCNCNTQAPFTLPGSNMRYLPWTQLSWIIAVSQQTCSNFSYHIHSLWAAIYRAKSAAGSLVHKWPCKWQMQIMCMVISSVVSFKACCGLVPEHLPFRSHTDNTAVHHCIAFSSPSDTLTCHLKKWERERQDLQ